MTNANADDYAVARQNIFFTANDQTPADGNLTGQCVTLVKWFFLEMCINFPSPFMARGNAKDVGHTLVAQGLAVEVPYSDRRRGDIVCLEYGQYGHIYVQLSSGRVFEENVNWSGVASRVVDGEVVYASRIGSDSEAWRATKNPHVYRLKSYNEQGDYMEPTFNEGDAANFNVWHFGRDEGKFREYIGQKYKDAIGNICTSVGFQTDQLLNAGDLGNLKDIIGTQPPDSVVGKSWKRFCYEDLKPLIPTTGVVPYSGAPLFTKKG